MAVETFLIAGGVAAMLGVVVARLMRVLGLALLLVAVTVAGILRIVLSLPHPSLMETLILLVLVQAGYLLGVLVFGGPEAQTTPTPRSVTVKDDSPAR